MIEAAADLPLPDAAADGAPAPPARSLRPREKLRARGPSALTDAELLALVLGSGAAGRSALRSRPAPSREKNQSRSAP